MLGAFTAILGKKSTTTLWGEQSEHVVPPIADSSAETKSNQMMMSTFNLTIFTDWLSSQWVVIWFAKVYFLKLFFIILFGILITAKFDWLR